MRLYRVDSSGGQWLDVTANDFDEAISASQWFWLDVAEPQPEEIKAVQRVLDLPGDAVDDVVTPNEFPKVHEYPNVIFAISHSPGLDEDRFTTSELDVFLGEGFLVTFHRQQIPGLEWAMARDLDSLDGPADVLTEILEAAAHRYLTIIDALDAHIDELESMAIAGNAEVLGRIQALRRDAIVLRSLLGPERDTVRSLSRLQLLIPDRAQRRLEAMYDDYFRIVESLDAARQLLAATLDTYRSTVAERTNEVMKVLTVFSAIFLPLSLLAGIYGMNFINLPELEWRWGYFALLGIMTVVAIGLWLYFAWRGFVGGPKIPRVDRTLGRGLAGLVHLTTAPVRGVLSLLPGDEDA